MATDDTVSEATKSAEKGEGDAPHTADRPATEAEAAAADRSRAEETDGKEVAEHYEEMAKLGAEVKGEGEIE